jgi:twitching motility protein PilT
MPPVNHDRLTTMLQEICPAERWQLFMQSHDLDFAYAIPGRARFRCNYLNGHHGIAAVFRLIPSTVQSMKRLRLPEVLTALCGYDRGLILVTGPTGSGKSTTLAAMIHHINSTVRRKIVTVEDPLEFVHQNRRSIIVHREVGLHCDSFSSALRSAMRSNPDIIMVGELRDLETIRLALNCAAMGMLVFGTLHTNSAPKTVDRIIEAFPANEQAHIRAMLAESLAAVVSQLLCRRCDRPGRVAAHEILIRTPALPNTIREGQTSGIRTIIDGGGTHGMVSMDASLEKLLLAGTVTPYEAYMKAANKEMFAHYVEEAEKTQVDEVLPPLAEVELPPPPDDTPDENQG